MCLTMVFLSTAYIFLCNSNTSLKLELWGRDEVEGKREGKSLELHWPVKNGNKWSRFQNLDFIVVFLIEKGICERRLG